MRTVLQRVREACVSVDAAVNARIATGLLALVSFARDDAPADLDFMADKILGLRVFEDAAGKMNLCLADVGGELLVVPNFTLHGDCRRGRRPSFSDAAPPADAEALFALFLRLLDERGAAPRSGVFGAHMEVSLVNDGPVTLLIDSRRDS
jgi:D-tyrosyl-tRNA(Tyr) deacylase